jgi:hypothetical protein
MVSGRDEIDIESFLWDYAPDGNVSHLHGGVTVDDVEAASPSGR